MSKLKLITTTIPSSNNLLYILETLGGEINSTLAYKSGGNLVKLVRGGSPESAIIKCSDLKEILRKYFIQGTKFIASTYNPTLYYLFPGYYKNQFSPDTDFVPTLNITSLLRAEVDGFNKDTFPHNPDITQDSLKSIKACDSWYSNTDEYEDIVSKIDSRIKNIFGYYRDFNINNFDIEKEVHDKLSGYSLDVSKESIVVSLLSETSYTDTINLEDWVYKSGKGNEEVSGKLDISFMYSKGGNIHGGMQTIKAFEYSTGNVVPKDTIINLGDVQIEYFNYILKIYPLSDEIDEIIINDCVLTIGVL